MDDKTTIWTGRSLYEVRLSDDPEPPWVDLTDEEKSAWQKHADRFNSTPAFKGIADLLNENRRLREEVTQLREDLDQAVGYRLAVREQTRGETKGDQDRDV